MIKIPYFDDAFIRDWEQRYYKCEKDYEDEQEYQELIEATREDIARRSTVSKETLRRILKWKDRRERVERKVKWERYDEIYGVRFRLIVSETVSDHHKPLVLIWDKDKLQRKLPVSADVLDKLNEIYGRAAGFGVPVASTVLHFMYPEKFPIIDIRTAEVLYLFGKIRSTDRNKYSTYIAFRLAILETGTRIAIPLHKIDRALFAYHRDTLQPVMNEKLRKWYEERAGKDIDLPNLGLDASGILLKMRQSLIDAIRVEEKADNGQ